VARGRNAHEFPYPIELAVGMKVTTLRDAPSNQRLQVDALQAART
jgi:hypothetical protein